MQETSEELPNFSIGIDFLGPDPTRGKNKAEKNLQVARFANLNLRASLCKILTSSFAHKIDFAHNFSVDFFN